jgi:hypothetical protein
LRFGVAIRAMATTPMTAAPARAPAMTKIGRRDLRAGAAVPIIICGAVTRAVGK